MKKLFTLVLLTVLILVGCSQGNVSEETLKKEIAVLKEENKRLKEELKDLKGGDSEEVAREETDELSINKGIYREKDYEQDVTLEYTINKYGFVETYMAGTWGGQMTTEGKFLVLEIYLDNIGIEEYGVSRSQLVIDKKGREYRTVDILNKDKEIPGDWVLKPGFNTTAYAIFEVPFDFEIDKYKYYKYRDSAIKVDFSKLEEHQFDF